ncbi:5507_t:CDS:2 [Dentiscutata erythropus]|uniref:5507_t:CDS:1 n=1 Tax=Dentiscutata erythropus TaxID=1348616 RepID=A0A9N9NH11_9GLOM|nr:5507_t:CDS:2 [Dentiscutata erythropus]
MDYESDPQIEFLTQNNYQYSKIFSELDSELLDFYSDDSDYTYKQKKEKFRAIKETNHQELNNNSKCIHKSEEYLVNKNDLFEDNILDIGEDLLVIKKAKIDIGLGKVDKLDKNNSLYSRFNQLIKKK